MTSLSVQESKAVLYGGDFLQYGELIVQNEKEETLYIYTVTEMYVDEYEKDIQAPASGYTERTQSVGKLANQKPYLIAVFAEGAELLATMKELEEKLIIQAYTTLFVGIILFGVIFLIFGVRRIRWLSIKLPKQVIHLYETVDEILRSSSENKNFELSFKASSKELNEL